MLRDPDAPIGHALLGRNGAPAETPPVVDPVDVVDHPPYDESPRVVALTALLIGGCGAVCVIVAITWGVAMLMAWWR